MNRELAGKILDELAAVGVTELCLCPGGRNAPLIEAAERRGAPTQKLYFYDERSAAFFALGRIQRTRKPVAVLTTSGTAAGELLPAAMEAYYSGLPLILVTADRPRRFRGTGAPQVAEQVGIFGQYCPDTHDIERNDPCSLREWTGESPLHLNVCFDEPLLAGNFPDASGLVPKADLPRATSTIEGASVEFFSQCRRPLAIVGSLAPSDRPAVRELLLAAGIPTYFESTSGLREDPGCDPIRVHVADRILERAADCGYPVDGILRIGGVPTHRIWRDLEQKHRELLVVSISRQPFSGLARPSRLWRGDLSRACLDLRTKASGVALEMGQFDELLGRDRELRQHLNGLLQAEPNSEPGMIHALSRQISADARVFLGNSQPIREWDLAATWRDPHPEIGASRGLNGIDGQVSAFLGYSSPAAENWGIFGDLTALYDLSGPWILPQLRNSRIRLAIVNNQGGKIFARMFPLPTLQNEHTLRFESWARLWGMAYEPIRDPERLGETWAQTQVLEILPDAEATERFWRRYEEL